VRRFRKHVVGGGTLVDRNRISYGMRVMLLYLGAAIACGLGVQSAEVVLFFSKVVIPKRLVDDIQKNKAFLVSQIVK